MHLGLHRKTFYVHIQHGDGHRLTHFGARGKQRREETLSAEHPGGNLGNLDGRCDMRSKTEPISIQNM